MIDIRSPTVHHQKDVPAKTGAESLACIVFFTKGLKEGIPFMIDGHRKKGEMAGYGSVNGRV